MDTNYTTQGNGGKKNLMEMHETRRPLRETIKPLSLIAKTKTKILKKNSAQLSFKF